MKRNRQRGFSLIELLIVVTIILIIAAIAVPKFLQARATASQANAAASMRSINTALAMFNTSWSGYPASITVLGGNCAATPPTAAIACTLDDTIAQAVAAGTYNNYTWAYTQTVSPSGFVLTATPAASNNAIRSYYLDQGGTIHYADSGAATAASPVIGN
jgi:prepilin-type N-terminal cleavage/methylation domain-containing protein